jgi:hypothetical protein
MLKKNKGEIDFSLIDQAIQSMLSRAYSASNECSYYPSRQFLRIPRLSVRPIRLPPY